MDYKAFFLSDVIFAYKLEPRAWYTVCHWHGVLSLSLYRVAFCPIEPRLAAPYQNDHRSQLYTNYMMAVYMYIVQVLMIFIEPQGECK